jgi:hypothetical protein
MRNPNSRTVIEEPKWKNRNGRTVTAEREKNTYKKPPIGLADAEAAIIDPAFGPDQIVPVKPPAIRLAFFLYF